MADRIVVMHKGHIEQTGTPLDLYDRPANLFVAGFIGSPAMNTFECRIMAGDCVAGDGTRFGLSGLGPEGPAVLGLRPEDLVPTEMGLEAEVLVVEPTGSEPMFWHGFAARR